MWVTFDWDNRGLEDILVQKGLKQIAFDFHDHSLYYRVSSGGDGIHAFVADTSVEPDYTLSNNMPYKPLDLPDSDVLHYRENMVELGLEDPVRLKWDTIRDSQGGRTGKIFFGKKGNTVGEWILYVE